MEEVRKLKSNSQPIAVEKTVLLRTMQLRRETFVATSEGSSVSSAFRPPRREGEIDLKLATRDKPKESR